MWDVRQFCQLVDHTLLKPEATREQIEALCAEADRLATRTVCVNGMWVRTAAQTLSGSPVGVCAVVGFPLGAMQLSALLAETAAALDDGATEIDMVIPLGYVKGGGWSDAGHHVTQVRSLIPPDATLKVILEAALLADGELVQACNVSRDAGADFVKTSTGFNPGRRCHGPRCPTDAPDGRAKHRREGGRRHPDPAGCAFHAGGRR